MIVYTSTALSINPEQHSDFKRLCHNVIACLPQAGEERSDEAISLFSPFRKGGERGI